MKQKNCSVMKKELRHVVLFHCYLSSLGGFFLSIKLFIEIWKTFSWRVQFAYWFIFHFKTAHSVNTFYLCIIEMLIVFTISNLILEDNWWKLAFFIEIISRISRILISTYLRNAVRRDLLWVTTLYQKCDSWSWWESSLEFPKLDFWLRVANYPASSKLPHTALNLDLIREKTVCGMPIK